MRVRAGLLGRNPALTYMHIMNLKTSGFIVKSLGVCWSPLGSPGDPEGDQRKREAGAQLRVIAGLLGRNLAQTYARLQEPCDDLCTLSSQIAVAHEQNRFSSQPCVTNCFKSSILNTNPPFRNTNPPNSQKEDLCLFYVF